MNDIDDNFRDQSNKEKNNGFQKKWQSHNTQSSSIDILRIR